MADINERKTPEEIKEKMLEALNDRPLNAQEISKAINSNWSTVKNYVEELVREGKIKEILFNGQVIYLKIIEDSYFNIPIKEKDRKMFKFIFYNAIKTYKETTGKAIRRTELAKLSAEINNDLKLDLPIVWYLYGPMPLMIIDVQKDYSTNFEPENADKIKRAIDIWINRHHRNLIRELRVECYQKSNNTVYFLKEQIYRKIEKREYDLVPELFFEFFTAVISYDRKFEKIMEEFYRIVSGSNYLKLFENLEFQNKFLLAFDSLWKYLALNMLINSLIKINYPIKEMLLLLKISIESKEHLANENINELKEFYEEHLPAKVPAPKLTEINEEARNVIDKWTESGVWRE